MKQKQQTNLQKVENKQTIASFVKEKVSYKINKLKHTFSEMFLSDKQKKKESEESKFEPILKRESLTKILESD